MPLRVRRRPDTGALEIYGTVKQAGAKTGVRVRQRPGTDDPELAAEEARSLEVAILREAWHGKRGSTHNFSEAALSYLNHTPRSDGTKDFVRKLTLHFSEMPLDQITQDEVDRARHILLRKDAAPATVKRNLIAPLRAILVHAARRKWCPIPVFDVPPEPKGRVAFLLPEQVERLASAVPNHMRPLVVFLTCTGCRLSEALSLEWREVDLVGARVILWEGETKGGSRRVINLVPAARAALAALPNRDGRVFLTHRGQPYREAGSGRGGGHIKTAWRKACERAGVEATPHVLRHTWASWHYALNRDLLLLVKDGGWANAKQPERYAHLMPAGHEAAIRKVWGIVKSGDTRRTRNLRTVPK